MLCNILDRALLYFLELNVISRLMVKGFNIILFTPEK